MRSDWHIVLYTLENVQPFDTFMYYNLMTTVVLANNLIMSHVNLNLNRPRRELATEIKQWLAFAENNRAKLMITPEKLFPGPVDLVLLRLLDWGQSWIPTQGNKDRLCVVGQVLSGLCAPVTKNKPCVFPSFIFLLKIYSTIQYKNHMVFIRNIRLNEWKIKLLLSQRPLIPSHHGSALFHLSYALIWAS